VFDRQSDNKDLQDCNPLANGRNFEGLELNVNYFKSNIFLDETNSPACNLSEWIAMR